MSFFKQACIQVISFCMGALQLVLFMSAPAHAVERPKQGLWVTFRYGAEEFQVVVEAREAIDHVLKYTAGQAPHRVLLGKVRRGGAHNSAWSWHLEPKSLRFADDRAQAEEADGCDQLPSSLERDIVVRTVPVGRYCPREARIAKVEDCRSGQCITLRGLYAGRSPF
ncbi:MAG: hypothetical protein AB1540_10675 [Bdellovibrionota bacterium]